MASTWFCLVFISKFSALTKVFSSFEHSLGDDLSLIVLPSGSKYPSAIAFF
jgi:hypothetical protein